MERPFVVRTMIVVALCSVCGCSSARRMSPLTWFHGGEKESLELASKETDKKDNVLKSASKKKNKTNDEATHASVGDDTQSNPNGSSNSGDNDQVQTVSHDVEILKIIDAELYDFPLAERERIHNDLKGVPPHLVQQFLRTLRMNRQMSQQSRDSQGYPATAKNPTETSPNVKLPGLNQDQNIQLGYNPVQPQPGLGTSQPWNNPTDTRASQPGYGNPSLNPTAGTAPNGYQHPVNPATNVAHNPQMNSQFNNAATSTNQGYAAFPGAQHSQQYSPAGYQNPAQPSLQQYNSPGAQVPNPNRPGSTNNLPGNFNGGQYGAFNQTPGRPQQPNALPIPGSQPVLNQSADTGVVTNAQSTSYSGQTMSPHFDVPNYSQPNGMTGDWKPELDKLIASTEAAISSMSPGASEAEKHAYLKMQVYLRMLYMMAGQQPRALEAIRDINSADQEFWQQTLWGLSTYFDDEIMPNRNDRATQTVAQLRTAVQRLQENAKLDLRNVSFCHKISDFGNYQRYQRDEFRPNDDVLIYAEIINFKSELAANGQFRSLLNSMIEIFRAGPNGELVSSLPFQPNEEFSNNPRNDYFHSYNIRIPATLSPGPYILKLRVEDQLSRKMAEYPLKFTVR